MVQKQSEKRDESKSALEASVEGQRDVFDYLVTAAVVQELQDVFGLEIISETERQMNSKGTSLWKICQQPRSVNKVLIEIFGEPTALIVRIIVLTTARVCKVPYNGKNLGCDDLEYALNFLRNQALHT